MRQILKSIHFEMFKNNQRQEQFMKTHPEEANETIRNDERISQCRHFDKVLKNLEDFVLNKL